MSVEIASAASAACHAQHRMVEHTLESFWSFGAVLFAANMPLKAPEEPSPSPLPTMCWGSVHGRRLAVVR